MRAGIKSLIMRIHYGWILGTYTVLSIIVMAFSMQSVRNDISDYNEEQVRMVTGLLVENVNSELNNLVVQAEHVSNIVLTNNENKDDKLATLEKYCANSSLDYVGFFDESKIFYGDMSQKADLVKMGVVSKAVVEPDTYITDPYRSSVTGQYMLSIFVPAYEDGVRRGTLFANLKLENIADFASSEVTGLPARICMFNSKSLNYIACTDMNGVPAGSWNNLMLRRESLEFDSEDVYTHFLDEINAGKDDGAVCFSYDGRAYTLGFSNIEKMENWYIGLELGNDDLSDTFTRFRAQVYKFVLIILTLTIIATVVLVSKELVRRKEFQTLSSLDAMTGIYNKRTFESLVKEHIDAKQGKHFGMLIFIDVDNFKHYNDEYGHLNGDIVLKTFARNLTEQFGSLGYVGRYGGDEFVLFVRRECEKSEIDERIAKTRELLANIELEGFGNVPASFSAGGACYPADGTTFDELCNAADKALYQVKESGKAKFYWYR